MITTFANALNILGYTEFNNQITKLAELNFNQWYDTYYNTHHVDYPNPEKIRDNFIKVANGNRGGSVLEGLVYIDNVCNKIIGTITLNLDDLAPEKNENNLCINNVYVLDSYRGKGIAKQLIKYMMTHITATRPHLKKINLFCEHHLIPFYKSLGWKLINNIPTLVYWYEMEWCLPETVTVCSGLLAKCKCERNKTE